MGIPWEGGGESRGEGSMSRRLHHRSSARQLVHMRWAGRRPEAGGGWLRTATLAPSPPTRGCFALKIWRVQKSCVHIQVTYHAVAPAAAEGLERCVWPPSLSISQK